MKKLYSNSCNGHMYKLPLFVPEMLFCVMSFMLHLQC